MTNKRTIRLYGELGKKFGRTHKLYVNSVGEAIRALCANFKGFREHLLSSDKVGYEVWEGSSQVEIHKKSFCKQGNADIKIIPKMLGNSAGARIGIGVVLIAVANMTPAGTFSSVTVSTMTAMGASLVLGGIAELITASVASKEDSSTVNSEGYIFGGPQNTTKQGNPVAIGYGELIVGSQVISATLTTSDIPITYE